MKDADPTASGDFGKSRSLVTKCFYKLGDAERVQLGQDLQSTFLSTDTVGGFQGVTLGVIAHN